MSRTEADILWGHLGTYADTNGRLKCLATEPMGRSTANHTTLIGHFLRGSGANLRDSSCRFAPHRSGMPRSQNQNPESIGTCALVQPRRLSHIFTNAAFAG